MSFMAFRALLAFTQANMPKYTDNQICLCYTLEKQHTNTWFSTDQTPNTQVRRYPMKKYLLYLVLASDPCLEVKHFEVLLFVCLLGKRARLQENSIEKSPAASGSYPQDPVGSCSTGRGNKLLQLAAGWFCLVQG